MNKTKFHQLQKAAGLSNVQAAEFFEVTTRNIVRWRIENPKAPKAVIMCLESIVSKKPVDIHSWKQDS